MKKPTKNFGVCLENTNCHDLLPGKIYAVISDSSAEKANLIRVIDESGEDYLYPSSYFFLIALPLGVRRALSKANKKSVA